MQNIHIMLGVLNFAFFFFFLRNTIWGICSICRFSHSVFYHNKNLRKNSQALQFLSADEAAFCRPYLYTTWTPHITSDLHLKNTNMQMWCLRLLFTKPYPFLYTALKKPDVTYLTGSVCAKVAQIDSYNRQIFLWDWLTYRPNTEGRPHLIK